MTVRMKVEVGAKRAHVGGGREAKAAVSEWVRRKPCREASGRERVPRKPCDGPVEVWCHQESVVARTCGRAVGGAARCTWLQVRSQ